MGSTKRLYALSTYGLITYASIQIKNPFNYFLAGLSIDAVTILRALHECYFEQVRIELS